MADDRVCQGYHVIDSIRVDKTEVVLAHNPNAPCPYVTWKCYSFTGYKDFNYGCYFLDEKAARESMHQRADELRKYLPPGHRDKKPPRRKRPPDRER